jgi:hypothetical protein
MIKKLVGLVATTQYEGWEFFQPPSRSGRGSFIYRQF